MHGGKLTTINIVVISKSMFLQDRSSSASLLIVNRSLQNAPAPLTITRLDRRNTHHCTNRTTSRSSARMHCTSTLHEPNEPIYLTTRSLIAKRSNRKPATPPQPPPSTAQTTTNNVPVSTKTASYPTSRLALRVLAMILRVM